MAWLPGSGYQVGLVLPLTFHLLGFHVSDTLVALQTCSIELMLYDSETLPLVPLKHALSTNALHASQSSAVSDTLNVNAL